jgi:hypothetical protein
LFQRYEIPPITQDDKTPPTSGRIFSRISPAFQVARESEDPGTVHPKGTELVDLIETRPVSGVRNIATSPVQASSLTRFEVALSAEPLENRNPTRQF